MFRNLTCIPRSVSEPTLGCGRKISVVLSEQFFGSYIVLSLNQLAVSANIKPEWVVPLDFIKSIGK